MITFVSSSVGRDTTTKRLLRHEIWSLDITCTFVGPDENVPVTLVAYEITQTYTAPDKI
jgi:hypothetical protein